MNNSYQFKSYIGKGDQGKVLAVIKQSDMQIYAAKQIKLSLFNQKLSQKLLTLRHPFIIKFHAIEIEGQYAYYIMEYINGKSLYYFTQGKQLADSSILFYSFQILLSLKHLHEKQIIYRDVKPENLLLQSNGYLKLIDFDLSKVVKNYNKTKTFCGTPLYIAPECIMGNPYNKAVDYWSLGILIYELCVGKTPFEGNDCMEIYQNILNNELVIPDYVSGQIRNLLVNLLKKSYKERLRVEYLDFYEYDIQDMLNERYDPPFVPN